MNPIRFISGLMAAVPLGVLVALSYTFGRDTLGEGSAFGPLYGVLLASFGIVGAVATFAASEAWRQRQRGRLVAAVSVVAVSIACSALSSLLTLGARQAVILAATERAAEAEDHVRQLRIQLAGLPAHRPLATVADEIRIRTEAARRDPKREPFPVADRVALNTELGHAMRAGSLRSELEAALAVRPPVRSTAAFAWLADQLQRPLQAVGLGAMLVFILAAEVIGAFGLFVMWGGHSPPQTATVSPARKEEAPAPPPAREAQPSNVVPIRPAPAPAAASATLADPVAAFIASALKSAPGVTTAFADIQRAWEGFCERHGITSDAVNLGIALKAAGYDKTKLANRRVAYAGVSLAA